MLQGNDKEWKTGSLELMTAGKGIIHAETITARTELRILQLWLVLPPEKRWTEPFWQQLLPDAVPTLHMDRSEIRVYSGSSHGLTSPLLNQTPFTLVDFRLKPGASVTQSLPASMTGFIYVLKGTVILGQSAVNEGQIAWLDRPALPGESHMLLEAAGEEAHFVLYAGTPQQAPVVSHGPFIGDSRADIIRLYQEYRQGEMPHLNDLPANRKRWYGKVTA